MLSLLEAFFTQYGYAAVFFVLVACGFGVPIPEDVTLVAGGVISGLGYANVHIMVAVGMLGVLVGDGLMFTAGRVFGHRILKARFVARVMTPKRYAQVQEKFDKYGRHQPQSVLSALFDDGRLGGADFRAGVGVFGRLWRGKHRLADAENPPVSIRPVCADRHWRGGVGLFLVEKAPAFALLPRASARIAGSAQGKKSGAQSR